MSDGPLTELLRWDSNVLTSVVHLVEGGVPLCGQRNIILADEDEGGVPCGVCVRIAKQTDRALPPKRGVSV